MRGIHQWPAVRHYIRVILAMCMFRVRPCNNGMPCMSSMLLCLLVVHMQNTWTNDKLLYIYLGYSRLNRLCSETVWWLIFTSLHSHTIRFPSPQRLLLWRCNELSISDVKTRKDNLAGRILDTCPCLFHLLNRKTDVCFDWLTFTPKSQGSISVLFLPVYFEEF